MNKLMTLCTASAALLALTACDGPPPEYDCADKTALHSKQWTKEKQEYCAAQRMKARMHTHADGTEHNHEFVDPHHVHELTEDGLTRDDGVFEEGDNDYSRDNTTDYTEDDDEIIEWRKQQREMKAAQ